MTAQMQATLLALLTGAFLPIVTGFLTKASWGNFLKFFLVIVVASVVGFAELYLQNMLPALTWDNAIAILSVTYLSSAVIFWGLVDRITLKSGITLRDWLYAHGLKDKA